MSVARDAWWYKNKGSWPDTGNTVAAILYRRRMSRGLLQVFCLFKRVIFEVSADPLLHNNLYIIKYNIIKVSLFIYKNASGIIS